MAHIESPSGDSAHGGLHNATASLVEGPEG